MLTNSWTSSSIKKSMTNFNIWTTLFVKLYSIFVSSVFLHFKKIYISWNQVNCKQKSMYLKLYTLNWYTTTKVMLQCILRGVCRLNNRPYRVHHPLWNYYTIKMSMSGIINNAFEVNQQTSKCGSAMQFSTPNELSWQHNYLLGHKIYILNSKLLKVAISQKILEKFYISNINIPNHYTEQKIWISRLKQ